MNKKTLIQTVIVIACFSASGFVLYKGLFSGGSSSSSLTSPLGVAATVGGSHPDEPVLPNGSKMDFDGILNKQTFKYGILQYPKLDPQNDIGKDATSLIPAQAPMGGTK